MQSRDEEDRAAPVGRLAPSPTGRLHVGHARSFLVAWWHARARGGRIVLRLEDLDATRVKPGMVQACLEDLAWLGLDWDGPVCVQSEGSAGLRAALDELVARGLAYPCVCTRREIELAASAPHQDDGTQRYPGTCHGRFRDLAHAEAASGRRAALRFLAPAGEVRWVDGVRGPIGTDVAAEVGDFPLTSRDGQVSYQLAVVVDDARQGVTEVVRGDDLLSSTARQFLLQRALSFPSPAWYHLPLVVDATGRRLAKRSDDLSLASLRARGVAPEALVAWCARSAGQPVEARSRATDLVATFALERLPRDPAVFTPADREALLASSR